ncbi:MAG: alanyl-tRNA synthetase [Chloroflexota bacterium]|jgi:alanyl-tRNA synthetase|nr:alanyl-tRNA synthetase [Chloroflexota bacterium]
MLSAQIRQSFLNFFAGQDHRVVPSSSLIPHEDNSVLLTTAGMQQFKPYFMGLAEPPSPRATSVQKCFRTVDLEEVGDLSHLTFFEMLGNFSFGDYFKAEAIEMAWRYLTVELGIPAERLQPTIHPDDAESAELWPKTSAKTPYKLTDNFWAAGATGPCGPDSEIYFDWGPSVGCRRPGCYPSHCDRYLEVWNLVFMQYDRQPDGSLPPLAGAGVDTGMGVERLAAVMAEVEAPQGRSAPVSVYETDVLHALQEHFMTSGPSAWAAIGGTTLHPIPFTQLRVSRLLSDHTRGVSFLVADGVRPSNEGRGYVLRRMIRRASLQGRRALALENPLSTSAPLLVELMGDSYLELAERRDVIVATIEAEERLFYRTLEQGLAEFEAVGAQSHGRISGGDAFRLHDTFGFPVELTEELATEANLEVDRIGFESLMQEARERSRRSTKKAFIQRTGLHPTQFVGYDSLSAESVVTHLFDQSGAIEVAGEGRDVEVYLARSPFYAAGGGQVADLGHLEGPEGIVEIGDVQRTGDVYGHYGKVTSGYIGTGDVVRAEVDRRRRLATMRHHSATHLLHQSLRLALGSSVEQAGSFVGPANSTFDFTFDRPLTEDERDRVFRSVNGAVLQDLPQVSRVMSIDDARRSGAMMLFGEKYGDVVRVVSFGDFSSELCGGTHVARTGEVGLVTLSSETSVGAGVRRIEFLAGEPALLRDSALVKAALRIAETLKADPMVIDARVEQLYSTSRILAQELADIKKRQVLESMSQQERIGALACRVVETTDLDTVRDAAARALEQEPDASAAIAFGRGADDTAVAVVKVRRGSGLDARRIFERAADGRGGKGGGSELMAQGGGFEKTAIADAFIDAAAALSPSA